MSNDVIREGHAGMALNVGEQNDTVATWRVGSCPLHGMDGFAYQTDACWASAWGRPTRLLHPWRGGFA